MIEAMLAALTTGLAAGLNAGPLSVVVAQQTLQHGLRDGLRVCLAPLITDGPIILLSVVLLSYFGGDDRVITIISLLGGAYLVYLASKMLFSNGLADLDHPAPALGLGAIIKVNALNPNPYLFWTTIGGTYIVSGDAGVAMIFIFIMLATLIASKMLIACLTSVFRERIQGRFYVGVNRLLGMALLSLGVIFIRRAYSITFS